MYGLLTLEQARCKWQQFVDAEDAITDHDNPRELLQVWVYTKKELGFRDTHSKSKTMGKVKMVKGASEEQVQKCQMDLTKNVLGGLGQSRPRRCHQVASLAVIG